MLLGGFGIHGPGRDGATRPCCVKKVVGVLEEAPRYGESGHYDGYHRHEFDEYVEAWA